MPRSFWCWYSFPVVCTQLKTDQVHVEDPGQTMQAAPNPLQKSKWLILQFPTATSSSTRLWLSIQFVKIAKRSGVNNHPCRSPTSTVNSCDLMSPIRTKTYEQECSDLKASNRRPSAPYCRNTSKTFLEEFGRVLFQSRQNMQRHLLQTPKISVNLVREWNAHCSLGRLCWLNAWVRQCPPFVQFHSGTTTTLSRWNVSNI